MARFIRDEKKTYPLTWLVIGGLFAGSTVWAVYAEFVTRVPWQQHQQAFFEMELQQSKQSLERAKQEWEKEIEPSLKDKLARKDELEQSIHHGEYKKFRDELDKLNQEFADAEMGKTFGGSDLDEAYYYRNLAEYERDFASKAVHKAYQDAYAAEDPKKGGEIVGKIYADPEPPAKAAGETDKILHLRTEVARAEAHVAAITAAMGEAPASVRPALMRARAAESEVLERVKVETKHQARVDAALAAMARIDGPADPQLIEKDPAKRAEERKRERARVCQGQEHTRNCITWLELEPVDVEYKAIDVELSKRRRTLVDAELREKKAEDRANPKFDPGNLINSLVGPYQIQQSVLSWIDYDREVDKEQVDRCQTCHMGTDNGSYTSAAIARQFRTHPHRSILLAAHPVEKFGCTSCHQGQGRATDMLSHSGWHLEEKFGKERWHFAGDHYWEDPLLPVGELRKIIVDDQNDELAVKVNKGKWETIRIDHRSPAGHAKDADVAADYKDEEELFGDLQEKIGKVLEAEADLKAKWHAVVRKVDNRVQIGLEQNDPAEHISAKETPVFAVKFPKREVAAMFGFGHADEASDKLPLQTATEPPSVPIRSDGMAYLDKDGRYHPPRGELGLQIPDDMRNRFIEALPEVEAGCLRCHQQDVDLRPRTSKAKYISAKLDYEKAEAFRKKDPEGYRKAHDGQDELPPVPANPADAKDLVPTFDEGRTLFKKLNCTGCHILENYPWDRTSGPGLDNVTAKVAPEWLLTWIRYPRGWRAKTRMPNLWPKPLDPATKRPYPQGSPEYADWERVMREETTAIASFLVERSDNPSSRPGGSKDAQALKSKVAGYIADVPDASAEKGKVIFESYGCQACHARSDMDTASEKLPEPWRSRERDIAPTLANMGSKSTADWIAYWVEQPNRYWSGTKMPNLRLSHEEAASVGKYIASLKDEPLAAAKVASDDVAIVSDPAKRNERVACANAGGQMLTRVECGEKLIGYYGCFGCHQIGGFEKNAPVAPELGGFAKKDVSTLDFGYAIADHHLQTTETFATLKLDSPRIYRRDRIELRMGDFDLSPREIRSLVTFLKGLAQSRPKPTYDPNTQASYSAALAGRQIVEDYNCRGCHVIEERGADIDAFRQDKLGVDAQQRAPFLGGEGMRVQPEWLFSFLRDPATYGVRPFLHPEWAYGKDVPDDKKALRMPTFNLSAEQVTAVVRYFASWDGQEYPYQTPRANELSEGQKTHALTMMVETDKGNCLSCHFQGAFPKERGLTELAKMAPNLNNVSSRLRPEWVRAWLLRPMNWLPYTKMTAFWANVDRDKDSAMWPAENDPFISKPFAVAGFPDLGSEQQAEIIRDFLYSLSPASPPFPKAGEEASSPLVKTGVVETAHVEDTEKVDDKAKDKDKDKDKDKKKGPAGPPPKKRTGSIEGPARF